MVSGGLVLNSDSRKRFVGGQEVKTLSTRLGEEYGRYLRKKREKKLVVAEAEENRKENMWMSRRENGEKGNRIYRKSVIEKIREKEDRIWALKVELQAREGKVKP